MKKKNNNNTRIFVIEDDPMFQKMIKYILELNPDHEVHVFNSGEAAIKQLHLNPQIISLDYTLPDMTGAEILQKVRLYNKNISIIILSSQQDVSTAIQLLREGAYDYITKDDESKDRLINTVEHIKNKHALMEQLDDLKSELQSNHSIDSSIIGQSQAMQQVFTMLKKTVRTNITVSITGETGTGKEVIAKAIHYNSDRKKGAFVAVNMSAIPNDLLESELFGYEKGAFTGANTRKRGLFELADNGTLFLDEICEMDISIQAKVLRVLQERELRRLGGEQTIKFDTRIIVATHRNILDEVNEGRFREDLYYRIMGLPIHLPSLRERGNDILLLANHFLKEFTKANKLSNTELSRNAKDKLLGYSFPGNVRELKAIIDLAAVMTNTDRVSAEDIQFRSTKKPAGFLTQEMTFEDYKKEIINHFLEKYNNDINLVATKLQIGKSTIYRMLKNETKTTVEQANMVH